MKGPPANGFREVDWGVETFGGFYVGKFEASHADATPGNSTTGAGPTAGSSATLKVAQYCVPWTNINWDQALNTAANYYPAGNSHSMRDDEWTGLAVWAMINGKAIYGNNAETSSAASYTKPADIDSGDITFVDDITCSWSANGVDRALTGSATSSLWAAGTNKSTHTGTTGGVYDLNGNIWEWTQNVGTAVTSGNYGLFDSSTLGTVDLGFRVGPNSGGQVISGLSTDPRWRRFGLPGATNGAGDPFGNDVLWDTSSITGKALRGGDWGGGSYVGVWALNLDNAPWLTPQPPASSGFRCSPPTRSSGR